MVIKTIIQQLEDGESLTVGEQKKNNTPISGELKGKLEVVDKIIEMYPNLKKEKASIIENVIGGKKKSDDNDKMIVEKFEFEGKTYYRDKCGAILDSTTKLVGI